MVQIGGRETWCVEEKQGDKYWFCVLSHQNLNKICFLYRKGRSYGVYAGRGMDLFNRSGFGFLGKNAVQGSAKSQGIVYDLAEKVEEKDGDGRICKGVTR